MIHRRARLKLLLSRKAFFQTKFHQYRSAVGPTGGAYSAPPAPLAGFKGPTSSVLDVLLTIHFQTVHPDNHHPHHHEIRQAVPG